MHSLLDIDPPTIVRHLSVLQAVNRLELFDDRASDATFITVIVTLVDTANSSLEMLREALLQLSDVTPFVVDEHGEETPVASISSEELGKYSKG